MQILLGPSGWDAMLYVRGLTEDTATPYLVPDSAYQAYAEDVNEDFSRHIPLDYIVGNPYDQSSPWTTQTGLQRYLCSSANGFAVSPIQVTDVLYYAGSGFSVASEIAYLTLMPFSPVNRFLFSPNLLDSPSERILRDEYLDELVHYGRGGWRQVRDPATGVMAIDLYPIPVGVGVPVYARYLGAHAITTSTVNGQTVLSVPTVPEDRKRDWAKLLYAMVLEEEGARLLRARMVKAGLVEQQVDTRTIEQRIVRIREEVTASLGGYVGVIMAS